MPKGQIKEADVHAGLKKDNEKLVVAKPDPEVNAPLLPKGNGAPSQERKKKLKTTKQRLPPRIVHIESSFKQEQDLIVHLSQEHSVSYLMTVFVMHLDLYLIMIGE